MGCKAVEGILYVSLIEISLVVIETQGAENGNLVALVNNTLVCRMSFLAANTQPSVLIESDSHALSYYTETIFKLGNLHAMMNLINDVTPMFTGQI